MYDRASRQTPLETETLDAIKALYTTRRTEHYYGTNVTTKQQADGMLDVATILHDHLVAFDLKRYCQCERG